MGEILTIDVLTNEAVAITTSQFGMVKIIREDGESEMAITLFSVLHQDRFYPIGVI